MILDLPLTEKNNPVRFAVLEVCPICGEDYNVIDGVLKEVDYKGRYTWVTVCPKCKDLKGKKINQILVEKIEKFAKPEDLP